MTLAICALDCAANSNRLTKVKANLIDTHIIANTSNIYTDCGVSSDDAVGSLMTSIGGFQRINDEMINVIYNYMKRFLNFNNIKIYELKC